MPQARTLYIGLDGHKAARAGADVTQQHGAGVTDLGTIGTRQGDIAHRSRKGQSKAKDLVFVDEAGPCGDGRSRYLTKTGHACRVVAPALMPQKAGARVNTGRRDATPRARLARSGDLTVVSVPKAEDEAIRDLTRARADPLSALQAATFRLTACWLRHAIRSTGRAPWSPAQLRWRAEVVCPTPAPPSVVHESVRAGHEQTGRLQRLDQERREHVKAWRVHPAVEALQALRGVQCTAAGTLVADRGDLTRFGTPGALRKSLGLIPSA
jgi:transposase